MLFFLTSGVCEHTDRLDCNLLPRAAEQIVAGDRSLPKELVNGTGHKLGPSIPSPISSLASHWARRLRSSPAARTGGKPRGNEQQSAPHCRNETCTVSEQKGNSNGSFIGFFGSREGRCVPAVAIYPSSYLSLRRSIWCHPVALPFASFQQVHEVW